MLLWRIETIVHQETSASSHAMTPSNGLSSVTQREEGRSCTCKLELSSEFASVFKALVMIPMTVL